MVAKKKNNTKNLPLTAFVLTTLMMLVNCDILAQQIFQIRTMDKNRKPVGNLEVSVGGIECHINNKGIGYLELNDSIVVSMASLRINSDKLEVGSISSNNGVIEVTVREINYLLIRLTVMDIDRRPVRNVRITFNGKESRTASTDEEGRCKIAVPLEDKDYSIKNFQIAGYELIELKTSEEMNTLFVERSMIEVKRQAVLPEASEYLKDFKITQIDSIQSLTIFYAVLKKYDFKEMSPEFRRKMDAKFNELVGRRPERKSTGNTNFVRNISDSSYIISDIRNLIRQALYEKEMLEQQEIDFDAKVGILSKKMVGGFQNMTVEQRVAVRSDLEMLERLLIENEKKFFKNQQHYREILGALKKEFFDIEEVTNQLSISEAQRQQEQEEFQRKLLIILSVSTGFVVLIILLILFSFKLRKQKVALQLANNEVKRINENLEFIVLERTKLLEQSNRELDTFLYRASHDLRSPICTIIGLTNLLTYYSTSPEMKSILEKMLTTTDAMDRLLQKLTIISELNSPKNFQAIRLADTIHYLVDVFQQHNVSQEYKVDFIVNCSPSLIINSYHNLIHAILYNLIENSLQYSRLKGNVIVIEISATTFDHTVQLSVKDNGIGMNDNIRPRVFDMFFKGNESSTGNGLGLYIVQRSVQTLKGKIILETEPDQYTKFIIQLPVMFQTENRLIGEPQKVIQ